MATHIRKVAREVLGVEKGRKQEPKDMWWWNEDVQKAIKEKECYKSWFQDRSTRKLEKYKEAKRNARRAVSGAKGKAYDEFYEKLDSKEGEMEV